MNGSGRWHAEQAWLGHRAENVLIEVENGRISAIEERIPAPPDAIALKGWTVPGFANVHSHAFQRLLRGEIESGGGDFWEWRAQMYRFTEWDPADYFKHARLLFREMLEAGITAVGEFHYLHGHGNELGEALIDAAREEGIRITLIDACYLRGGMDGGPLEAEQLAFSDGDADSWARRMDELKETNGARIAAAIHSVRAVDPESMRVVATYARERRMPLHIHLAEQAAEVEACLAVEGVTPTELLQREGILGPDLTAVHAIHLNERDISLLGENGSRSAPAPQRNETSAIASVRCARSKPRAATSRWAAIPTRWSTCWRRRGGSSSTRGAPPGAGFCISLRTCCGRPRSTACAPLAGNPESSGRECSRTSSRWMRRETCGAR